VLRAQRIEAPAAKLKKTVGKERLKNIRVPTNDLLENRSPTTRTPVSKRKWL
jgi:hypothetical protein